MDILSVILHPVSVSLFLLIASVGLIISHVRSWRAFRQQALQTEEYNYRRRQYRRRMQTSGMLGVLAVALGVGYGLTIWLRSDVFIGVFWLAMMLLACWVALLALADVWATKYHFGRLRQDNLVEQVVLQAEIRRIQAVRGNGKAESGEHKPSAPADG